MNYKKSFSLSVVATRPGTKNTQNIYKYNINPHKKLFASVLFATTDKVLFPKKMMLFEKNAKLNIFRNLVFLDRCNLRTVNKDFNDIFKKYKHEKIVYSDYDKNINYGEYIK